MPETAPTPDGFRLTDVQLDELEQSSNALKFLTIFLSAEFFNRCFEAFFESRDYLFSTTGDFFRGPSSLMYLGSRYFLDPVGVIVDICAIPVMLIALLILYRTRLRYVFGASLAFVCAFLLMVYHQQKYWYWKTGFREQTIYSYVGYFLFLILLGYVAYLFVAAARTAANGIGQDRVLAPAGMRAGFKNFFPWLLGIPSICEWLPKEKRLLTSLLFAGATVAFCFFVANLWSQGLGYFPNLGHSFAYVHACFAANPNKSECWQLTLFAMGYTVALTAALIGLPLLVVAGLRFGARRLSRLSLERLISKDKRAPLLFLRSFRDDQVRLSKPRQEFIRRVVWVGEPRPTLDHILLEEGIPHGPVIAIGAPGSTAPFGAARTYVTDEEWKATVSDLCSRAEVIVITVDETEGVRWEVEHLVERNYLAKTLFLIPPRLGRYDAAKQVFSSFFGKAGKAGRSWIDSVSSLLKDNGRIWIGWFWTEKELVILTSPGNSSVSYALALRLFLARSSG